MAIMGKYVQLLKEAVPKVSRVAVLTTPTSDPNPPGIFQSEMEAAARTLDVKLQFYGVREPEELEGAFAHDQKGAAEALLVVPSWLLTNLQRKIAQFAAQSRLQPYTPLHMLLSKPGDSCPMGSTNLPSAAHRLLRGQDFQRGQSGRSPRGAADQVRATHHLKTAKALGLKIPQSLLIRADEVIQ